MKVYATVAQVSAGQVVVGVSLTKTGAKQAAKETILSDPDVFEATVEGKVKAGDQVVVHMVRDGAERLFDYLSIPTDSTTERTMTVLP